jgi:hypothetical protein
MTARGRWTCRASPAQPMVSPAGRGGDEDGVNDISFDDAFRALTGHEPFAWQGRLYAEHFARDEVPAVRLTERNFPSFRRRLLAVLKLLERWLQRCVASQLSIRGQKAARSLRAGRISRKG